ncbi:MAG TPA: FkbM family methyltransferase [Acidimicrobiales bacterium]|nr:FkbM family methyltransferase [Acidimicrobiales bacterium]
MALKASVKAPFLKSGRVWTGPARGAHLEGPNSLRVYSGLYQVELNRWIRRLLAPRPAIFDIGAQYGFDAIMFARLGSPEVLTVEANPELKGVIERNVQRNDMGDRVTIDINWVGDGTGDTVTLDQLAEGSFMPGFIKMDIEGAEASALRGAPRVLRDCDRWLIATHSLDVENECLTLLCQHGFLIETVDQRRWLPDYRPTVHNRWIIARRP